MTEEHVGMDGKQESLNAVSIDSQYHINSIGDAHKKLFELSKDAVLLLAEEGFIEANSSALDMFNVPSIDAFLGLQLCDVSPLYQTNRDSSEAFFQNLYQTAVRHGSVSAVCQLKQRDNSDAFSASIHVTALMLQNKSIFQIRLKHLSDNSDKQVKLGLASDDGRDNEWHATHDALTRLPNRTLLKDRFAQAIYSATRHETLLAVCMLDLDEFKPVNDTYGHEVGDQLLVQVSSRIKQGVRQDDTAARLGGDEFVILLGDIKEQSELLITLERLKKTLAQPYYIGDITVTLSCSIGVSLYPKDPSDADTLLRHADQAMYVAKQAGKNRVHWFDMAQDQKITSSQQMITRVEQALLDNEFELFYQPKVDMREGVITGMEALLRWNHPEKGLVPPLDFLPIVENDDLIIDIGQWVIEQVLTQQAIWQEQGHDWVVSVNIASRHLHVPEFYQQLKEVLARHPKVRPEKLEIEILESVGLGDVQRIQELIINCQALGVGLALDDFGTGYSSLSYLKRLPAETLKIDQTFIRDILDDKDDLALVQAIVGLAKTFNRKVVAEGVETIEHGVLLLRLGCDHAQGFGIARPMPANAVVDWAEGFTLDDRLSAWSQWEWDLRGFPLLVAAHDVREWIDKVILRIENETLPVSEATLSDENHCRFGNWYKTDGVARYGALPAFKDIDPTHIEVHKLGDEIVRLYRNGETEQAREKCMKLHQVKDKLLSQLDQLEHLITSKI
jgi:diguanylate cyclase (GGDEF)-like protein